MSDFKNLKSMWEARGSEQAPPLNKPPPPKTQPGKLKIPNETIFNQPKSPSNQGQSLNPPKAEKVAERKASYDISAEAPRQSVMELKKNLQGKVKFGNPMMGMMGAPMPPSENRKTSISIPVIVEQKKPQQQKHQTKKQPIKIEQQNKHKKDQQEVTSFHQSRQNIQLMFQKQKSFSPSSAIEKQYSQQRESHSQSPKGHQSVEQNYIFIKNDSQKGDKLTPEERTEQIMNRIFSIQENRQRFAKVKQYEKTPQKAQNQDPFDDQVYSLKVRRSKQKKQLENFDEA